MNTNTEELVLIKGMTLNEFVVKVLSDKMIEELQDPMLFRKRIPDY